MSYNGVVVCVDVPLLMIASLFSLSDCLLRQNEDSHRVKVVNRHCCCLCVMCSV